MALPRVPAPDGLSQLPNCRCPGIYFLWSGRLIVYVGQSKTVNLRVLQHIGERKKKFDAFSFIRCDVGRLNSWERTYIEGLLPRYNQCNIARMARQMKRGGFPMPSIKVDYPVRQEPIDPNKIVTMPAEDVILTLQEAAAFLGVSEKNVRDWTEFGLLPSLSVLSLLLFVPDMKCIVHPPIEWAA